MEENYDDKNKGLNEGPLTELFFFILFSAPIWGPWLWLKITN